MKFTKYKKAKAILFVVVAALCINIVGGVLAFASYDNAGGQLPAEAAVEMVFGTTTGATTNTSYKDVSFYIAVFCDRTWGNIYSAGTYGISYIDYTEGSSSVSFTWSEMRLKYYTNGGYYWSSSAPTSFTCKVKYGSSNTATQSGRTLAESYYNDILNGSYSTTYTWTHKGEGALTRTSNYAKSVSASTSTNNYFLFVLYWEIKSSYFSLCTYTLNLDPNGGTVSPTSKTVTYSYSVSLPTPSRTGYTFLGWYKGSTKYESGFVWYLGGSNGSSYTFTAHWGGTVTFNSNGGSACSSVVVEEGKTYGTLPAPTRPGYTFSGWYKTSDCSGAAVATTDTVTMSHTLYAKWTALTFNITFKKQGGSGGTETAVATYDSNMPAATKPTYTGYNFLGYYLNADNTTTQYYTATMASARTWNLLADTTLYAHWAPLTYNIVYNSNGGTGSMASSTHTYDTAKTLTANSFSRAGYNFSGWALSNNSTNVTYLDGESVLNLTETQGAQIVLYAVWVPAPAVITFDQQGGGNGTVTVTATFGLAMPSIVAPTRTNFVFDGYYTQPGGAGDQYYNSSGAGVRNWDLVGATTLYAKWMPWLNIVVSGSVNSVGSFAELNAAGTKAEINIYPAAGHYVQKFSFDNSLFYEIGNTRCAITNLPFAVEAIYSASMATNVWGLAINYIVPNYITSNGAINLYIVTTTTPYEVLKPGNASVNGVAVSATLGGCVTVIGDDYENLGDSDTITVKADICLAGYQFVGWYLDSNRAECLSREQSVKFKKSTIMDSQLVAVFAPVGSDNVNGDTGN